MSRTLSPALQTLLAGGEYQAAYLLRLSVGGSVLYLTTWDDPITHNANTYSPKGFRFKAEAYDRALKEADGDIEISNVGLGISALVANAALGSATVEIDLFFPDVSEAVSILKGRPALKQANEDMATFTVIPATRRMEEDYPPHAISALCRWRFADAVTCQAAHGELTGQTADAGCTNALLVDAARTEDTGYTGPGSYWADGYVTFTSGALTGHTRAIQVSATGSLTLEVPFDSAPATGDQYTLRRGCNRTFEVCDGRFNNVTRFGGFVDLPT